MDIMLSTAGSTRDVVPLFKLVPGTSMGSFGYACARASGIDDDVVTRAEEIARAIESGNQIVPAFNNVEVGHFDRARSLCLRTVGIASLTNTSVDDTVQWPGTTAQP